MNFCARARASRSSGPASGSGDSSDASTRPSDAESSEGSGDPDGPEVFELFADPPALQENGVVTITAHVTDPDGLDCRAQLAIVTITGHDACGESLLDSHPYARCCCGPL
ncbi:MAG TPA: hypothetical protein VG755_19725 [Nannocystaceae bacterium]|nr:hypothetical protein [Nannocystaceae bacterium]